MIRETIIQEIEATSGFSLPDFVERMNAEKYDAFMVMKKIREKLGRFVTDDLLITEFGFKKAAINRAVATKKGDCKWMSNGIITKPWK